MSALAAPLMVFLDPNAVEVATCVTAPDPPYTTFPATLMVLVLPTMLVLAYCVVVAVADTGTTARARAIIKTTAIIPNAFVDFMSFFLLFSFHPRVEPPYGEIENGASHPISCVIAVSRHTLMITFSD